jgi:hypothetical protein
VTEEFTRKVANARRFADHHGVGAAVDVYFLCDLVESLAASNAYLMSVLESERAERRAELEA